MHVRVIWCLIISLSLGIACTSASEPNPTSTPTPELRPTATPTPQVRVTPLKPGENPWQLLAVDGSPAVKLLSSHPTQPGWIHVVTQTDGKLIVSKNGGKTWQAGDLSGVDLVKLAPMDPTVVYIIAEQRTRLWKSHNGGLNFQRLKTPVGESLTLAVSPSDADTIYLVGGSSEGDLPTESELFRSDDGGENWVFIAQLPVKMGFKGDLLVDPTQKGHIYATLQERSISESKAFESWDGGVTWREVESLKYLTPMKWILTQGQSPTAYLAVRATQSGSQVPSYVAARPKSVRFPLPRGSPVEVFPSEQLPEYGEFMVLDAVFSDPDLAIGRYMGGANGGAILLTQDGGATWTRLDTAGWLVGEVLYSRVLVRELALVATDPLTVFAVVHWPLDLQGLWVLKLGVPYTQARLAPDRCFAASYRHCDSLR